MSQSIFWAAKINLAITDGVGTTSILRCSPHTFTKFQFRILNFSQMFHMRTYTLYKTIFVPIGENVAVKILNFVLEIRETMWGAAHIS